MPEKQFDTIQELDGKLLGDILFNGLESIPGVDDIEYSGHYGPSIFLTIDGDVSEKETKLTIQKVIEDWLQQVALLKKSIVIEASTFFMRVKFKDFEDDSIIYRPDEVDLNSVIQTIKSLDRNDPVVELLRRASKEDIPVHVLLDKGKYVATNKLSKEDLNEFLIQENPISKP